MMKLISFLLLSISFLFCFVSCNDDTKEEENEAKIDVPSLVSHYWKCDKAERNGKIAASIDGLFFDFSTKDTLKTNMMGDLYSNPYSIEGDTIVQKGTFPMKFALVSVDSNRMQLNMEMNATKFAFYLIKEVKGE